MKRRSLHPCEAEGCDYLLKRKGKRFCPTHQHEYEEARKRADYKRRYAEGRAGRKAYGG